MPGSGYTAKNLIVARSMLEHCRFAYKAYAQTCKYPLDPFFESDGHGPRSLLMKVVRESADDRAKQWLSVRWPI